MWAPAGRKSIAPTGSCSTSCVDGMSSSESKQTGELRAKVLSSEQSKDTARETLESRIKTIDESAAGHINDFFGVTQQKVVWTGVFELQSRNGVAAGTLRA